MNSIQRTFRTLIDGSFSLLFENLRLPFKCSLISVTKNYSRLYTFNLRCHGQHSSYGWNIFQFQTFFKLFVYVCHEPVERNIHNSGVSFLFTANQIGNFSTLQRRIGNFSDTRFQIYGQLNNSLTSRVPHTTTCIDSKSISNQRHTPAQFYYQFMSI